MKFITLISMLVSTSALADTYVNGYTKSDGTQVQGYYRSDANDSKFDNYSTKGNVNPYTNRPRLNIKLKPNKLEL